MLHDIGKIGVPNAVLQKPGRLGGTELAQIRTHPEIGAEVLGGQGLEDLRSWVRRPPRAPRRQGLSGGADRRRDPAGGEDHRGRRRLRGDDRRPVRSGWAPGSAACARHAIRRARDRRLHGVLDTIEPAGRSSASGPTRESLPGAWRLLPLARRQERDVGCGGRGVSRAAMSSGARGASSAMRGDVEPASAMPPGGELAVPTALGALNAPRARAGSSAPRAAAQAGRRHPRARALAVRPGRGALAAMTRSSRPPRSSGSADAAVDGLRERGSPAHDGMATRLAGWREEDGRLLLDLQPVALGAAPGRGQRLRQPDRAVRGAHGGRSLAGRAAGRVGLDLGEPLGARRRRRRGPGREPGRDALARAARGVAARARAAQRRGAAGAAERRGDGGRAGHRRPTPPTRCPTTSTTSGPGGRPTSTSGPSEADDRLRLMGRLLDDSRGLGAPRRLAARGAAGRAHRAGHAGPAEPAVAVRVLREVLLVVVLGVVELRRVARSPW